MEEQITSLTFSRKNSESPFNDFKAGHYSIRTTEYQSLINWYKEKLDFRLIKEWTSGEMQLAFMALPNDDSFLLEILGVKNIEQETYTENKAGYDHICFNVMDLNLTIEELNKRKINILRSFKAPAIGKRVAFILDPFGNKIEFCEDIK
ncbi:VOC family protein [Flavobacterium flavigenum]|uniref:VOC family protein n=1 Tax=Flavobacterium flavigenum TaxID=3003258 RepID=UPI0022AC245D|nr:VOC family protein [Flavobacterium flavigenum]